MPTMLNCGRELGEVVEMPGKDGVVIGESPNDPYLPENEQQWMWESVPCERRDDGTLVIEKWEKVSDEAQRAIVRLHDNVVVGESEVMELIE